MIKNVKILDLKPISINSEKKMIIFIIIKL